MADGYSFFFLPATLNNEHLLPSMLWHCWLGSRKGIWPVKKLNGGMLACYLVWGADLHMAQHSADATATHYLLLQ